MWMRNTPKRFAAAVALLTLLSTHAHVATAADPAPTTMPAASDDAAAPQSIFGEGFLIASPPGGKRIVGLSMKTGQLASLQGDGYSMSRLIAGKSLAVAWTNDGVYAVYRPSTGTWEKWTSPSGAGTPSIGDDFVAIDAHDHLYVFVVSTGKWVTIY